MNFIKLAEARGGFNYVNMDNVCRIVRLADGEDGKPRLSLFGMPHGDPNAHEPFIAHFENEAGGALLEYLENISRDLQFEYDQRHSS